MKYLLALPLLFLVAACSPQAKTAWHDAKKEVTSYDISPWLEMTRLDTVFFPSDAKARTALQNACIDAAENRVISYSSGSEVVTYRQCAYSPTPLVREPASRINR
jgi:hypothetical protein